MNVLQEKRYKEIRPEETVKNIKKILRSCNIETEEIWNKKSSVGTYSLRLCVKGTNIGQNGKGMTKEFARASAYAEFMERYQNGMLVFRTEKKSEKFPFFYAKDEKELTIEELIMQKDEFIYTILKENNSENNDENILLQILENEKNICLPYYSMKDKKIIYLPQILTCHLCGTNGMCAGNSKEEALIEGISEIIERYVSMQIILKRITPPEIPEKYLKNSPEIYNMLKELNKKENYICKLLDCSLGGKYPVAGLIILEKNTGRFGFKLGAHPDYKIAIERCFTEAAQGMDISMYSKSCLYDFKNEDLDNDENIREFINSNVATIPYQILSNEKTYEFTPIKDITSLNNKEILKDMIKSLLKDGYDIIIRDVSYLGFPSFRVLIPKMSEIIHSKMAGRYQEFEKLENMLKNLDEINMNNIDDLISLLEIQINETGFTNLYMLMNIKNIEAIPTEKIGNGLKYLLSICYIMKEEYLKAEEVLEKLLMISERLIPNDREIILLRAVYYYTTAIQKLKSHEKTMYYIEMLFDNDIANKIDITFKEKNINKHFNIKQEDYVENDDSYFLPFMKTLKEKQKENNINQEKLKQILE